jgi:hypothetical protein
MNARNAGWEASEADDGGTEYSLLLFLLKGYRRRFE